MIHEHVIQKPQVAKAESSQPIVVGHWALFSLFLLWLTLLASAFTLGVRLG
jgi:hypothetical protein